ncbi:MAG: hypothetical protein ABTQ34_02285 [Bdellovibrionales bacterium]
MSKKKITLCVILVIYFLIWPILTLFVVQAANLHYESARLDMAKWMSKAADAGNYEAQGKVAHYYKNGYGSVVTGELLKPNPVYAYMYFTLAAQHGNAEAKKEADALALYMPPKDLAAAKELVRTWKPDLAPRSSPRVSQ